MRDPASGACERSEDAVSESPFRRGFPSSEPSGREASKAGSASERIETRGEERQMLRAETTHFQVHTSSSAHISAGRVWGVGGGGALRCGRHAWHLHMCEQRGEAEAASRDPHIFRCEDCLPFRNAPPPPPPHTRPVTAGRRQATSQVQNNYFAELRGGSEEGSCLRLKDFCINPL